MSAGRVVAAMVSAGAGLLREATAAVCDLSDEALNSLFPLDDSRAETHRQALVDAEESIEVHEPAVRCSCGSDTDDLDRHGFYCTIWEDNPPAEDSGVAQAQRAAWRARNAGIAADFSAASAGSGVRPGRGERIPPAPPTGQPNPSTSALLTYAAIQLQSCRGEYAMPNYRDEYLAEYLIPELRARAKLYQSDGD